MNRRRQFAAIAISVLACALAIVGFGRACAVDMLTVRVGNIGNAAIESSWYGAVDYYYRIGTYEVTNSQYAEFLNLKAASDPLSLYSSHMGGTRGGITRMGVSPNFTYAVKPNMGNKPVGDVTWYSAVRFVNWLNNGQGNSDTESGAYTLVGGVPLPSNGDSITRNSNAKWWLPSDDEWFKAAYHQPAEQGGDVDNYWLYPTASNSTPAIGTASSVGDISNPGPNVANYIFGADWNGIDGFVTTVGSAGPLSASFYGTFDQGGNVKEWTETSGLDGYDRGLVGGNARLSPNSMRSTQFSHGHVLSAGTFSGFRVGTSQPFFEGDANWDDVVDGSDYTVWADHYLSTVKNWTNGDLTGDGVIDGADYTVWADNYAPAPLTLAVVPEPSTLACACLGIVVLLIRAIGLSVVGCGFPR